LDNDAASFTVFAPTNQAFSALLAELGVSSLNDVPKATLSNILLYHVLDGTNKAASINTGYYATLASGPSDGSKLSFYVDMSTTMINSRAKITATDIAADNGVIHVIDKVILPLSIVDIAVNNPTFSILVSALAKADLVETLKGAGPFTVFAPTDAAFTALFSELGVSGIADLSAETLIPILLSHVVSGNITSGQLKNGEVETLNDDKKIVVNTSNGVTIDGDINVVLADVQGSNGIVHVIDKVIMPEAAATTNTIVDVAVGNEDFSILVAALQKANLVDALADEDAMLTVFAPTNQAFSDLLTELGASSLDDIEVATLTNILLYHVIDGKNNAADISTGYFTIVNC
jgi:transforming growth factor-beta-induced protein